MSALPIDDSATQEAEVELERCSHGAKAGEFCTLCDGGDWEPVDPRALELRGNVFRCVSCRALVLERDRDDHRHAVAA